jgi:hypothetical protein
MNKTIENQIANWRRVKAIVGDLIGKEEQTTFIILSVKASFAPEINIQLFRDKNCINFRCVTWNEAVDWEKFKDLLISEAVDIAGLSPTLVKWEGKLTDQECKQILHLARCINISVPYDDCKIILDGIYYDLSFGSGSPARVKLSWQNSTPANFSGIDELMTYLRKILHENIAPHFKTKEIERFLHQG